MLLLTCSSNEGEQEVETEKCELRSRFGFCEEIEKANVWKQRHSEEL